MPPAGTGAATYSVARSLDDPSIQDAIEREMINDHAVPFNGIDVGVTKGIVTLSGDVRNLLAKERALRIAETVKGVRSVVNELRVRPAQERSDAELKSSVWMALVADPATDSFEINVSTDDGVVTLTGTVQSWQEYRLAETVAKGVAGVVDVSNEITVKPVSDRSDAQIRADINGALRWDVLVNGSAIDVSVDDGRVTLSGKTGSAAAKSRAVTRCWVAGVTTVDDTGLKVGDGPVDGGMKMLSISAKSDSAVRQAVRDAMLYDPRVFSFNVNVDVSDGVATLRGTVDNLKAKRAAAEDARNTVGVMAVRNRLHVRPGADGSDEDIASEIMAAVQRNPYLERDEIDVRVVDGMAYLSGEVDTYFKKAEADDIAARVRGVTEVRNYLDVQSLNGSLTYDPYVDDWFAYGYDWYTIPPVPKLTGDRWIEQEINDELWWSPFVDADDVQVSVSNGVATLTGRVDSWSQCWAATENALEGGARWVRNELIVE